MSAQSAKFHAAVVTVAVRAPLEIQYVPTVSPGPGEVRVRVDWVASTPADLHQSDGGLFVTHPGILGDGIAGEVVEVGEGVKDLTLGDKVFGFTYRTQQEKGQQEFITVPTNLLGKIPTNISPESAAAVANNFVSSWHIVTTVLGISLPYPKPLDYSPQDPQVPFLIWGGGTSVGQYTIQLLRYYGYKNLVVTASPKHHEFLRGLGATELVDYRDANVLEKLEALRPSNGAVFGYKYVIDEIGSQQGSVEPLAKLTKPPAVVAMILPIILRDASDTVAPEYSLDAVTTTWAEGVTVKGVRTHYYLDDPTNAKLLQPVIMPGLLAEGAIIPNRIRIVEGKTLLERAQKALDILRHRAVSGERLVWRISEAPQTA